MRFRTKVTLALLLAALVPLSLFGLIGFQRFEDEAMAAAQDALDATGTMRAAQIHVSFTDQLDWLEAIAAEQNTISAVQDFAFAARSVAEAGTVVPDTATLNDLLAERHSRTKDTDNAALSRWTGDLDQSAAVLQDLFVVKNPQPPGSKQDLLSAPGGGRYSMVHRTQHPVFKALLERFGFYDIFLIDAVEGRIVYSVMKEPDYGTSLTIGPYRDSAFGKAAQAIIAERGATGPKFVDYSPYEPSFNDPAAFVLVPVGSDADFTGIFAVQLALTSAEAVVQAKTSADAQTLRNYILASDMTVRIPPNGNTTLAIGDRIESDLISKIDLSSDAPIRATNDLGTDVIASVEKIDRLGLQWVLVSEVAVSEALEQANLAKRSTFYAAGVASVVLLVIGLITAKMLLLPVVRMGSRLSDEAADASTIMSDAAKRAQQAVQEVASVAEETNAQAEMVRESSSEAARNVQEMSTAVEQLTSSIANVATGVRETANLMFDATEKTDEAERTLAELERVADRIRGMVDLIDDVANRTNLLALNAAVEAAHAGEAGRGFAVVASEIRKLAGRTTESTDVIAAEVKLVLEAVQANSSAIRDISSSVRRVSDMATSLSSAAEEQERVTDEIAQRMTTTAQRVSEVDSNIETVKVASRNSAASAASLVGELQHVDDASNRIVGSITQMAEGVRAL